MLKMTEIELELTLDIDMYLFLEKGMTGGVSCIAKRLNKANNKYTKCYDDENPSVYLTCLDANNFYGWTMSQYWPYSGFQWLNHKDIDKFVVTSIGENNSDGYIEVNLEYTDELWFA